MPRILRYGVLPALLCSCSEYDLQTDPQVPNTEDQDAASCLEDAPPTIHDFAPEAASVLPTNQSVLLEAWVMDDETPREALEVTWSTESGPLPTSVANVNGYAQTQWANPRPIGDQLLNLTVVDSCGNTSSQDIAVCQQGGFDNTDIAFESWHLEGSAWLEDDGTVELTGIQKWQVGSAFMTELPVRGDNLSIVFEFYTAGGNGADGLSLTVLDTDRMTTFLGGSGCGLGYGGDTTCDGLPVDPALPGWSLELDTWANVDIDPTNADHVAFTFDGQVASPEVWTDLPELEETGWHRVEVDIVAPRVTVVVNGQTYIDADIDGYFDFPGYIGFTGSTGGETNYHRVRLISVTQNICPEEGS